MLGLLWLSIVSFADFDAAGKQPAEYPDPGLIQVVDKNKRFIEGRKALLGGAKLNPVPTLPPLWSCVARLVQLNPPVKGLEILYPFQSEVDFRSSHSFSRCTRCSPAKAIRCSCLWILGVKPSDIFIRCAVNVAMF